MRTRFDIAVRSAALAIAVLVLPCPQIAIAQPAAEPASQPTTLPISRPALPPPQDTWPQDSERLISQAKVVLKGKGKKKEIAAATRAFNAALDARRAYHTAQNRVAQLQQEVDRRQKAFEAATRAAIEADTHARKAQYQAQQLLNKASNLDRRTQRQAQKSAKLSKAAEALAKRSRALAKTAEEAAQKAVAAAKRADLAAVVADDAAIKRGRRDPDKDRAAKLAKQRHLQLKKEAAGWLTLAQETYQKSQRLDQTAVSSAKGEEHVHNKTLAAKKNAAKKEQIAIAQVALAEAAGKKAQQAEDALAKANSELDQAAKEVEQSGLRIDKTEEEADKHLAVLQDLVDEQLDLAGAKPVVEPQPKAKTIEFPFRIEGSFLYEHAWPSTPVAAGYEDNYGSWETVGVQFFHTVVERFTYFVGATLHIFDESPAGAGTLGAYASLLDWLGTYTAMTLSGPDAEFLPLLRLDHVFYLSLGRGEDWAFLFQPGVIYAKNYGDNSEVAAILGLGWNWKRWQLGYDFLITVGFPEHPVALSHRITVGYGAEGKHWTYLSANFGDSSYINTALPAAANKVKQSFFEITASHRHWLSKRWGLFGQLGYMRLWDDGYDKFGVGVGGFYSF